MSSVRVMCTLSPPITVGLMIHWQAAFLVQWTWIYFLTSSEILLLSDHLVIETQSSMEEWHCSPSSSSSSSSISAMPSSKKKKQKERRWRYWEALRYVAWVKNQENHNSYRNQSSPPLQTCPSKTCLLCLLWDSSLWKGDQSNSEMSKSTSSTNHGEFSWKLKLWLISKYKHTWATAFHFW